jgi:hypothetical protein
MKLYNVDDRSEYTPPINSEQVPEVYNAKTANEFLRRRK